MLKLLSHEIQEFIAQQEGNNIRDLLLKKSPFAEVKMSEIILQIKGRKTAKKKFPSFMKEGILFPPTLHLEQSSSETTALYKKKLLQGEFFLDLTCGFGMDSFFISENFKHTTLVDQNAELLEIVQHNWGIWNKKAEFHPQNLTEFLAQNTQKWDAIFIDPSRRNNQQKKVFLLEDLSPNILKIIDQLLDISPQILIKLSPLIDLSYLITVLKNISEIHIIAVKNEVKEVLILLQAKNSEDPQIKTVNLETNEPEFSFYLSQEKVMNSYFSEPEKFLYLPNNAILKAGAYHSISRKFSLKKLHPNSHFHTSENRLNDFPGRILEIEKILSKDIQKGQQYNIISKNHPLKPEEIKKKYQLKDGGLHYLIFTQTMKEKIILRSK